VPGGIGGDGKVRNHSNRNENSSIPWHLLLGLPGLRVCCAPPAGPAFTVQGGDTEVPSLHKNTWLPLAQEYMALSSFLRLLSVNKTLLLELSLLMLGLDLRSGL
jgi:hypothetical protein